LARGAGETPLAHPVVLAHEEVEVAPSPPAVVGELGVGVAVAVGLAVLDPLQHEDHARTAKLVVDGGPVGQQPVLGQ
jgi:transketolase N-terminal domain/subunit